MKNNFKVTGVKETIAKLNLIEQDVRSRGQEVMFKAGTIVQARAQENIDGQHGHDRHRVTGNLFRNIKTKAGWASLNELVAVVGTDVGYAPYVEALADGGYLYPALLETASRVLLYLKNELRKIAEGVA